MLTYKVLGALLCYPDRTITEELPAMMAALDDEAVLPRRERAALRELAEELADAQPLAAEARYVSLFDNSRRLSLHLFEHVHGDSRERGQAMASLIEHYRSCGLEVAADELPDFLPLFLEFLSLRPADEARELLGQVIDIVVLLGARLEQRGSRYHSVFRALQVLAPAKVDKAAIADAVAAEPHEDTLAALDESWEEKPVTFGAQSPGDCSSACGGGGPEVSAGAAGQRR